MRSTERGLEIKKPQVPPREHSVERKKNMQNHDLWRTDGAEAVRVWLTGQLNSRKPLRTCQDNRSDADVMQGCSGAKGREDFEA